jgi:hypothetical protein
MGKALLTEIDPPIARRAASRFDGGNVSDAFAEGKAALVAKRMAGSEDR